MKLVLALCLCLLVVGCRPAEPEQLSFKMPQQMSNCKAYRIYDDFGGSMIVIHCPDADVTADKVTVVR